MAADLDTMNRKQLEDLLEDVKKALKTAAERERREAKKAAEKAAAEFGFSLSELTGTSTKSARASSGRTEGVPKYADPGDPARTWTGKGRQPRWFKEAIDAGRSAEEMEV